MQTVHGTTQPLELLALAPHPDDAEIGCGGTLIKAASAGKAVGVLELTLGELGTQGTPEVRLEEARAAAGIMGLAFRGNLALPDGEIGWQPEQVLALAGALRVLRPSTLLIPHREDRHPDHLAAYELGKRAVHWAGLNKAPLEGVPHRVSRLLYYAGNFPIQPQLLIDVEATLPVWERCVMAHASQFTGAAISETVRPDVLERRKARMMYWATFVGLRYVEAFTSELPLVLEGL